MWGNLLIGVVTGLVALSGVFYTQWRADQREQQRWDRERAHEMAIWERQDAARSYEHRRDAYVGFLNEHEVAAKRILMNEGEHGSMDVAVAAIQSLQDRFSQVQIFGTRAARAKASDAEGCLRDRALKTSDRPSLEDVLDTRRAFVDQARRDLHVSDE